MTFPERLDRLANVTGIPGLALQPARPRLQRWWPLVALVLAVAGLVLAVADPARSWRGLACLWAALTVGGIARTRGPLPPLFGPSRPDERERAAMLRAYAQAGLLIGIAAPLSLTGLAGWAIERDWTRDQLAHAVTATGFFGLTLWTVLPTLFASWSMRPPLDE